MLLLMVLENLLSVVTSQWVASQLVTLHNRIFLFSAGLDFLMLSDVHHRSRPLEEMGIGAVR
jgi:hypothetical protein